MRVSVFKLMFIAMLFGILGTLAIPTFAATPDICNNNLAYKLYGCLYVNGDGTVTAKIKNNGSQSQNVGVASYYKYENTRGGSITDQEYYAHMNVVVDPGVEVVLTIGMPDCSSQVDAYVGDVIYSFTSENDLYGNRKIVWEHFDSVPCDPGGGDEGCTPGYWKNHDGYWSQKAKQYVDIFFGNLQQYISKDTVLYNAVQAEIGSLSLDNALSYKGNKNKFEALLRSSAAGLLSASHPEVDYPLLASDVIYLTRDAWYLWLDGDYKGVESIKNELDGYNNLGCDLGKDPYP